MAKKAVWGLLVLVLTLSLPHVARAQYYPGNGPFEQAMNYNSFLLNENLNAMDMATLRWFPAQTICQTCYLGGPQVIPGSFAAQYLTDGRSYFRLMEPINLAIAVAGGASIGGAIWGGKGALIGGAIAGIGQLIMHHRAQNQLKKIQQAYLARRQEAQPPIVDTNPNHISYGPPQQVSQPVREGIPVHPVLSGCSADQGRMWIVDENATKWLDVINSDQSNFVQGNGFNPNIQPIKSGKYTGYFVRLRPYARLCIQKPEPVDPGQPALDQYHFRTSHNVVEPDGSLGAEFDVYLDFRDMEMTPGAIIYRGDKGGR